MARRSILSSVREEKTAKPEPVPAQLPTVEPAAVRASSAIKPSRIAKLHVGGYYYPDDLTIVAFQKLGIDLRRSQQDMLLEAIRDFVAKHEASRAFSNQQLLTTD
jgi:hypothetical protein